MKVVAFAARPDEQYGFDKFTEELNIEIKYVNERLSMTSLHEADGFDYISVLGNCDVSADILKALHSRGVRYIASRSAGYNNIDVNAAKKLGIKVSNATYSSNCVADFTVMLMLMSIRKVKNGLQRGAIKDFSLGHLQGKEMRNLTIGVIGTGRIGQTLIKNLSGFGCNIIAYDMYPNEAIKEYITYVDLQTLYEKADLITLHTPLFESTYHLINEESLKRMKDGVVIVNTARGELVDTEALIKGLETGKVGAAGLDVLENEVGVFHQDCRFKNINNREIALLKQFSNVVLTHHFAFYTDQAVLDMVECSMRSLRAFKDGMHNPYEIIL